MFNAWFVLEIPTAEVDEIAKATSSGTAVAPDEGITAEALKFGGPVLWELLAAAFTLLLRGGRTAGLVAHWLRQVVA